jgi:hypothetical protein
VSTEAEELQRIISTSARDMLNAYRIQAAAGPVTDKALEEIVFRGAQDRVHRESSKSTGAWPTPTGTGLVRAVTADDVYVIYTSARRRTISAFPGTFKGGDDGKG